MTREGWRSRVAAAARRPLLHFVLIGAILFGVYTWRNGLDERGSTRIDIDRGRLAWLAGTFTTQFGHAPTRTELNSLVDAYLTDEMSYREALAMGLDQDDSIVRRRMIQKYDFLNLDEEPETPSDAVLRAYFDKHRAALAEPALVNFCQVYVATGSDRAAALVHARQIGADLATGRIAPGDAGDAIDVPPCMTGADRATLRRTFGDFFAATLVKLPIGKWVAPVESGYGFHAVRVTARVAAPSQFEDRRPEVLAEWQRDERMRLRTERMARLRARYRVTIDQTAINDIAKAAAGR